MTFPQLFKAAFPCHSPSRCSLLLLMGGTGDSSGHVLLMFSPLVKMSAPFSRDNNSHMETGAIVRTTS